MQIHIVVNEDAAQAAHNPKFEEEDLDALNKTVQNWIKSLPEKPHQCIALAFLFYFLLTSRFSAYVKKEHHNYDESNDLFQSIDHFILTHCRTNDQKNSSEKC